MLTTISILTALAFATLYPLCFMISFKDPLKNNFHKFHLGLPNTIGGVVLVFVWLMDFPLSLKIILTIWKAFFLFVSRYSWKKEYPNPKLGSADFGLQDGAFGKYIGTNSSRLSG